MEYYMYTSEEVEGLLTIKSMLFFAIDAKNFGKKGINARQEVNKRGIGVLRRVTHMSQSQMAIDLNTSQPSISREMKKLRKIEALDRSNEITKFGKKILMSTGKNINLFKKEQ